MSLYFGGLPTDPDVKKLQEALGVPDIGIVIPHTTIAEIIRAPWKSSRYRTVVQVWRKRLLKEHNLDTTMPPGQGVKILSARERIAVTESDFKATVRKGRRVAVRGSIIPDTDLSALDKQRRDHVRMVTGRAYMAMSDQVKALNPPSAPPSLPRRAGTGHGEARTGVAG